MSLKLQASGLNRPSLHSVGAIIAKNAIDQHLIPWIKDSKRRDRL